MASKALTGLQGHDRAGQLASPPDPEDADPNHQRQQAGQQAGEQAGQQVQQQAAQQQEDEDADAPRQPAPAPPCEQCCAAASKYRCPGCGRRSCSLACVTAHKAAHGCSGQRDRAAFVSMQEFDDRALLSDFRLLEEIGRADDVARRCRPPAARPQLPPHLASLVYQASWRSVKLLIMPPGMAKRKANTSRYDARSRTMWWRLEWRFPAAGIECVDERVDEKAVVGEVLAAHLRHPAPHYIPLRPYAKAGPDALRVFMRKEKTPANQPAYFPIDPTKPLSSQLSSRTIIEYPVFVVALPHEVDQYPPPPAPPAPPPRPQQQPAAAAAGEPAAAPSPSNATIAGTAGGATPAAVGAAGPVPHSARSQQAPAVAGSGPGSSSVSPLQGGPPPGWQPRGPHPPPPRGPQGPWQQAAAPPAQPHANGQPASPAANPHGIPPPRPPPYPPPASQTPTPAQHQQHAAPHGPVQAQAGAQGQGLRAPGPACSPAQSPATGKHAPPPVPASVGPAAEGSGQGLVAAPRDLHKLSPGGGGGACSDLGPDGPARKRVKLEAGVAATAAIGPQVVPSQGTMTSVLAPMGTAGGGPSGRAAAGPQEVSAVQAPAVAEAAGAQRQQRQQLQQLQQQQPADENEIDLDDLGDGDEGGTGGATGEGQLPVSEAAGAAAGLGGGGGCVGASGPGLGGGQHAPLDENEIALEDEDMG